MEYGDYFIREDQKFSSLNELVGYYTAISHIDGHWQLKTPVPPPKPVVYLNRVIALYSYTKEVETDELSFQKGDIFTVHNELDYNWLWVTNHRSGERGIIYRSLAAPFSAFTDVNTMYSWFHPNCNKEQASNLLMRGKLKTLSFEFESLTPIDHRIIISADVGSFLVRPSEEYPKDYLLCVRLHSFIEEFRIENKDVYYQIYAHQFDSLNELIDYYSEDKEIVEGHRLRQPVNKISQQNDYFPLESNTEEKKEEEDLRISRDQLEALICNDTIQEGYLDLSTTKTSWQKCCIRLRMVPDGCILYMYETRRQIKHIGKIKLWTAALYQCHSSLWGIGSQRVEYSFKIVEHFGSRVTFTCLRAADLGAAETYRAWISLLQSKCTYPLQVSLKKLPYVRGRRSLKIFVGNAIGLPVDLKNCQTSILFGQIKIARTNRQFRIGRTSRRNRRRLVWNEEFELK